MTSVPKTAQQWRLATPTGIDQLHLANFDVPQPVRHSSPLFANFSGELISFEQGVDEVLVKLEACSLQFRDL